MIVGIDTGLSGALAVLVNNDVAFHDIPLIKLKKGNKMDTEKLVGIFVEYVKLDDLVIVYENNCMGAKLVKTVGIVEGICGALAIQYKDSGKVKYDGISSQRWQRDLKLLGIDKEKKKEASRQLALSLFPNVKGLSKKKDHNKAEALLIAHWWKEFGVHYKTVR